MHPRAAAYIVFPAATIAGVVAAWLVFRDTPDDSSRDDAAGPHRCAALPTGAPSSEDILRLNEPRAPLTLGVVADARGAAPATLERLRAAREAFAEAKVDLVLSLGGMGDDADELAAVYGVLAEDAPWQVVAIPGDREPWLAHRAAIDTLAASHPIRDGAAIRVVEAGEVTVGTFPGVAERSQLPSGAHGCLYQASDAYALASYLATREGVVVWAGFAPPRQEGPDASDRVRGVHIGDRVLAEAVEASGAALVLHGLVDEASLRAREGVRRLDTGQFFGLAPGPAEAVPVLGETGGAGLGTALIVRVEPPRVEWTRIDLVSNM